jgi:hypothetical protein
MGSKGGNGRKVAVPAGGWELLLHGMMVGGRLARHLDGSRGTTAEGGRRGRREAGGAARGRRERGRERSEAGKQAREVGMTDLPPNRSHDGKRFLFSFLLHLSLLVSIFVESF